MNLDVAAELCKRFEGFRPEPYLCPAGVWTIGYGTTRYPDGAPVKPTDEPVSEADALAILLHELAGKYAPAVARLCPGAILYPDRFNALADFCYNLGPGNLKISTLRQRVNDGDWEEAAYEVQRWVRGGGRVLPGLVLRRAAEAELLV